MKTIILGVITSLIALSPAFAADADRLLHKASRYFQPLPTVMPGAENDTAEKIALGKQLYFDTRLSVNDLQSCASCHILDNGKAGVDNLPTSPGAKGQLGTRNSPTVLNAGLQFSQFWDGRAENLVEQAKGPILNPIEMGMPNEQTVVKKISGIAEYQKAFARAFPDAQQAISYQNIAEAIAAFERTLLTPSRFDDFMNGDISALTATELQGLDNFFKAGCTSCHDGPLLGGGIYETMGKEIAYDNQADQGRFEVTRSENDKMVFKVSQLRNVALTAPYFHDGKTATLEQAIEVMARLQSNRDLSKEEVDSIKAFLMALTDKNREKYQ
jgi:cytochrome c peroxidase